MRCFSVSALVVLLLLAAAPGNAQEALGRLFYTSEQRARMDMARQHERSVKIDEEESTPQSASLQLNGVITRSDGKTTVWINNKAQNGNQKQGIEVNSKGGRPGQVSIALPNARHSVPLKVGQSLDVTSGQVEESYRLPPKAQAPTPAVASAAKPADVVAKSSSRSEMAEPETAAEAPQIALPKP